jgi:hypothetical protein
MQEWNKIKKTKLKKNSKLKLKLNN